MIPPSERSDSMKKRILPLIITLTAILLCSCGKSIGDSKFTCSNCSRKVTKAYADLLEEGTYLCEDCAEEYYGLLFSASAEASAEDSSGTSTEEASAAPSEEEVVIKTEFTLDELTAAMKDGTLEDSVLALKKGDTYYTCDMLNTDDFYIGSVGSSNDNHYQYIGAPDYWHYPEMSLSAGDQLVHFNLRNTSYSISISRIADKAYCIPFGFTYQAKNQALTVITPTEPDYADSFVGEAAAAGYPSADITDINDSAITDNPLTFGAFLCGEENEEITIGGFAGTVFQGYTYRCDRIAYLLETVEKKSPVIGQSAMTVRNAYDLSTDMAELTKEGYAVLISDTVNPLAPGNYIIGGCEITITE